MQTLAEVTVSVKVPPGTKGKMCDVQIKRNHIKVSLTPTACFLTGSQWQMTDGKPSTDTG